MKTGTISLSDGGEFVVDSPTTVTITSGIRSNGLYLPVECTADFKNIPEELHTVFLNHMIFNYNKDFNYGPWPVVNKQPKKSLIHKIWDIISI